MYNKRNFTARKRAFNAQREIGFRKPNNTRNDKVSLPRDILAINHTLRTNKDVRSYCAKALIRLHTAKGDILEGQKVFVEFNNAVYSIMTYPITEGNVKSYPIRNDFPYTTKEFYLALQASISVLSNVVINNFANYYRNYKPTFSLEDKELDKVFNSLVQSISSKEIDFQNRLIKGEVEPEEEENDGTVPEAVEEDAK